MKTSKLPYSVSLQSLMSEVKKQEEKERSTLKKQNPKAKMKKMI